MLPYFDGNWVGPTGLQQGAKQVTFPLQAQTEYNACEITREIIAAASSYYPIIGNFVSATNILFQSDSMGVGTWTFSNSTFAANSVLDPEGNQTGTHLVETATTGTHNAIQTNLSVTNGQTIAVGAFMKAGERNYGWLYFNDGVANRYAVFDLLNGAVLPATVESSTTAGIKNLGNGWYWCTITGMAMNTTASANLFVGIQSTAGGGVNGTYLGVAGSGIYVTRITMVLGLSTGFPSIQTTFATRSVTCPPVDSDSDGTTGDPLAFLTLEGPPSQASLKQGIADWVRTYTRIPKQQIVPVSYLFSQPNYPLVYSQGGSFSVSATTYTPPQLWNYIGDSIPVDANYLVIFGYFPVPPGAVTPINYGSVNGYYDIGMSVLSTLNNSSTININRSNASGISVQVGDTILWHENNAAQVVKFGVIASMQASTFGTATVFCSPVTSCPNNTSDGIPIYQSVPNPGIVRRRIRQQLGQGLVLNVNGNRVENYYLPGYTPGISSVASIPNQNPFSLFSYMQAIASSALYLNAQSDAIQYWKGPILVQKFVEILTASA